MYYTPVTKYFHPSQISALNEAFYTHIIHDSGFCLHRKVQIKIAPLFTISCKTKKFHVLLKYSCCENGSLETTVNFRNKAQLTHILRSEDG